MRPIEEVAYHSAKKRRRASTEEEDDDETSSVDARVSRHELESSIASLDEDTVRRLLLKGARRNPNVAASIMRVVNAKNQTDATKFRLLTGQVDSLATAAYRKDLGRQWMTAAEIESTIRDALPAITEIITTESFFVDKLAALRAFWKMGDLIINSKERVSVHLKQSFGDDKCLEDSIRAVLGCMTKRDKEKMRGAEGLGIGKALEQLKKDADGWVMFVDLGSIYAEYFAEPTTSP